MHASGGNVRRPANSCVQLASLPGIQSIGYVCHPEHCSWACGYVALIMHCWQGVTGWMSCCLSTAQSCQPWRTTQWFLPSRCSLSPANMAFCSIFAYHNVQPHQLFASIEFHDTKTAVQPYMFGPMISDPNANTTYQHSAFGASHCKIPLRRNVVCSSLHSSPLHAYQ